MNSARTGLRVSSLIFGLVALVHLWRLVTKTEIQAGTMQVPMSLSVAGLIVAGLLCIWLWRLSAKA